MKSKLKASIVQAVYFLKNIQNLWKVNLDSEVKEIHIGIKALLIFLGIFIIWASFAPINSSIITSGEIILTANKKVISHLEGGIIKEIKIKEGQFIHEGAELIILSTVHVDSKIAQILEGIKGLEFQKNTIEKRTKILKQELKIVYELLKFQNSSLSRKLELEKNLHESEGRFGEIISNIASLKNELIANNDILERSIVRAPVSGFIMDLKHQTIGGIIPQASEIMFIIPKNDKLIAEVKVKPEDIDLLFEGMEAKIQLSAYKAKLMPKLDGKLLNISADSFKNQITGEIYFKARIEILESDLKKLKTNINLVPGMPVNAFIITGSRTFTEYLAAPIVESAYKAFREE